MTSSRKYEARAFGPHLFADKTKKEWPPRLCQQMYDVAQRSRVGVGSRGSTPRGRQSPPDCAHRCTVRDAAAEWRARSARHGVEARSTVEGEDVREAVNTNLDSRPAPLWCSVSCSLRGVGDAVRGPARNVLCVLRGSLFQVRPESPQNRSLRNHLSVGLKRQPVIKAP